MKTKEIDRDDYWLGTAFVIAAGSEARKGCLLINAQSQEILAAASATCLKGNANHFAHPEITALTNCKSPSVATVYLTHTPCHTCVLSLLAASVRRVLYHETEPIDPRSEDAARIAFVPVEKFSGNLNWMRDYIKSLDIF